MEGILHQLIGRLQYPIIHRDLHPRWCRIASINSLIQKMVSTPSGCKSSRQLSVSAGNLATKSMHSSLQKTNQLLASWWFQPIWKILVKLEIIGAKIKNIWNHDLVIVGDFNTSEMTWSNLHRTHWHQISHMFLLTKKRLWTSRSLQSTKGFKLTCCFKLFSELRQELVKI